MKMRNISIVTAVLIFATVAQAKIDNANWVWYPRKGHLNSFPAETCFFKTQINIPQDSKITKVEFRVIPCREAVSFGS